MKSRRLQCEENKTREEINDDMAFGTPSANYVDVVYRM